MGPCARLYEVHGIFHRLPRLHSAPFRAEYSSPLGTVPASCITGSRPAFARSLSQRRPYQPISLRAKFGPSRAPELSIDSHYRANNESQLRAARSGIGSENELQQQGHRGQHFASRQSRRCASSAVQSAGSVRANRTADGPKAAQTLGELGERRQLADWHGQRTTPMKNFAQLQEPSPQSAGRA